MQSLNISDYQSAKKEVKETFFLSVPLIGSWLIYSLSGFVGTAMVARLGEDALAASVLTNTLWMVIAVFFFGMFNSLSVMVAHQFGAKNYLAVSEILGQAFLLAAVICIPIILTVSSLPFILRFTPQTMAVTAMAIEYAHSLLWSVPGVILLIVFENFLNGIGMTKLSLWISVIEVPIEIALIYVFVFGKLGLPECGIAGVGYGLAASYTLTVIVLVLYLLQARFAKPFNMFGNIGKFNKAYFWELLQLGLPVGITYLIEVGALMITTLMIARFSTVVLAAQQIVVQYLMLTINAAFAVAQAVSIRIGHNIGRKDNNGMRYACYAGYFLSGICMAIVSFLYIFFPKILLSIDLDITEPANLDLVSEAASLMFLLGIYQIFDGIRVVQAGALRGLKDTRYPMYVSFISFWLVALPFSYLFGFLFKLEANGVWWGMTVGVFLGTLLLFFRLQNKLKTNLL